MSNVECMLTRTFRLLPPQRHVHAIEEQGIHSWQGQVPQSFLHRAGKEGLGPVDGLESAICCAALCLFSEKTR